MGNGFRGENVYFFYSYNVPMIFEKADEFVISFEANNNRKTSNGTATFATCSRSSITNRWS